MKLMVATWALMAIGACGDKSFNWHVGYVTPAQRFGHEAEVSDKEYLEQGKAIVRKYMLQHGIEPREDRELTVYSSPDPEPLDDGKILFGITVCDEYDRCQIWFSESVEECDAMTSYIHELIHYYLPEADKNHENKVAWQAVLWYAAKEFKETRCKS